MTKSLNGAALSVCFLAIVCSSAPPVQAHQVWEQLLPRPQSLRPEVPLATVRIPAGDLRLSCSDPTRFTAHTPPPGLNLVVARAAQLLGCPVTRQRACEMIRRFTQGVEG
jgi:hypothetical protein